jgi:hypothetical protein
MSTNLVVWELFENGTLPQKVCDWFNTIIGSHQEARELPKKETKRGPSSAPLESY